MHRPRLTERDRVRIVVFRFEDHLPLHQIARKCRCSLSTVSRICKQHKHHVNTEKLRHHGRSKALSPSLIRHVRNIIRHNRNMTSTELQRHLRRHDNVIVSARTIRNYRRSIFHPAHELIIPRLTLQHHLDRIDYCMTHSNNNFHCVVFSDEKVFRLDHTSRMVWIEDDEPIPVREVQSTSSRVMVWGAVWYNGRSELCIVDGTVNHRKSIDILSEYLLPSMPTSTHFLFLHDNAPPHQPVAVESHLRRFAVRTLSPYPAQSPDFNAIEHVWSWMARFVSNECPKDRRSLIVAVEKAWTSISQRTIRSYIDGLPARIREVYDAGGARID